MTHADGTVEKATLLDPNEKYNEKSVPFITEEVNTGTNFANGKPHENDN